MKKELRKQMRSLRSQVTREEALAAEEKNYQHLRHSALYRDNQWIYPYISYENELPTQRLIAWMVADGKRVAVPKVMGGEMKFFEIHSMEDCTPGYRDILEPANLSQEITEKGLILMPGMAFDARGGRMGYGGGFYDRYLEAYPFHDTAGWLYDFQWVEEVPMESHDRLIDYLICPEKGLWDCKKEGFSSFSLEKGVEMPEEQ